MDVSYNGWRNRNTWLVNIYFGEYIYDLAYENCEEVTADSIRCIVEDYVMEMNLDPFISDIMDMSDIDYGELAEQLKEI